MCFLVLGCHGWYQHVTMQWGRQSTLCTAEILLSLWWSSQRLGWSVFLPSLHGDWWVSSCLVSFAAVGRSCDCVDISQIRSRQAIYFLVIIVFGFFRFLKESLVDQQHQNTWQVYSWCSCGAFTLWCQHLRHMTWFLYSFDMQQNCALFVVRQCSYHQGTNWWVLQGDDQPHKWWTPACCSWEERGRLNQTGDEWDLSKFFPLILAHFLYPPWKNFSPDQENYASCTSASFWCMTCLS